MESNEKDLTNEVEQNEKQSPALEPLIWEPKLVSVKSLMANPQNPKIYSAVGKKRLEISLSKFGLAGTIVANLDNTIIDGHSRVQEAIVKGSEQVWVSLPNRLLTEEEYKQMNAMYDLAKAGEPDQFMIENLFSDEVLLEWNVKKPRKEKGPKELYPIVPKYDEKHDAIIILVDTKTESTYIRNLLGGDYMSSYKNKSVGETFVISGEKFLDLLKKYEQQKH